MLAPPRAKTPPGAPPPPLLQARTQRRERHRPPLRALPRPPPLPRERAPPPPRARAGAGWQPSIQPSRAASRRAHPACKQGGGARRLAHQPCTAAPGLPCPPSMPPLLAHAPLQIARTRRRTECTHHSLSSSPPAARMPTTPLPPSVGTALTTASRLRAGAGGGAWMRTGVLECATQAKCWLQSALLPLPGPREVPCAPPTCGRPQPASASLPGAAAAAARRRTAGARPGGGCRRCRRAPCRCRRARSRGPFGCTCGSERHSGERGCHSASAREDERQHDRPGRRSKQLPPSRSPGSGQRGHRRPQAPAKGPGCMSALQHTGVPLGHPHPCCGPEKAWEHSPVGPVSLRLLLACPPVALIPQLAPQHGGAAAVGALQGKRGWAWGDGAALAAHAGSRRRAKAWGAAASRRTCAVEAPKPQRGVWLRRASQVAA